MKVEGGIRGMQPRARCKGWVEGGKKMGQRKRRKEST